MMILNDLPSPKRDRSSATGRAGWYPYYAGFSADFALTILNSYSGSSSSKILDPWNGSGTTTAVTAGTGYEGFGFDLNPVMVVVARARLLNKRERTCLIPLANTILTLDTNSEELGQKIDPLCLWFDKKTARDLRSIEFGFQKALLGLTSWTPMEIHMKTSSFSDLSAFFYVALFRTIRTLLLPFKSSNPTWTKVPKIDSQRITLPKETIKKQFLSQISNMVSALDADTLRKDGTVKIDIADSQKVPLDDNSIDFVLSSPPYCTRIDYASATRVELAVLGIDSGMSFNNLRRNLLGTPTVPPEAPPFAEEWGKTCKSLLSSIKKHSSKASSTYYYKSHCQYFSGVQQSLVEMHRCMKTGATSCLVIQDSFYKDIHNDLATIYTEMAKNIGMCIRARRDFHLTRSMGQVNSMSRRYRSSGSATESVLLFEKR